MVLEQYSCTVQSLYNVPDESGNLREMQGARKYVDRVVNNSIVHVDAV